MQNELFVIALSLVSTLNDQLESCLSNDSEFPIFVTLTTEGVNFYIEVLGFVIWDSSEKIQCEEDYILAQKTIEFEVLESMHKIISEVHMMPFYSTILN